MIRITVEEIGLRRGLFAAHMDERTLAVSRTPLFSAARVLIDEGHSPDDEICMQHIDSATVSIKTTVGVAARLSVEETGGAPLLRAWRARPPLEGSLGIASNLLTEGECPQESNSHQDEARP